MNLHAYDDIRRIVREELKRLRLAELAVVEDIHPHASESDDDNYACTVALRDSGLVLARVPMATARIGAVSIPAVGDLVLVQYVGGDINAPIITGSLYNDEDRPPPNAAGQATLVLPPAAGEGEGVHLQVSSEGETSARLTIGSSLTVDLVDDDPVVSIDVAGAATVTIASDGAVSIESQTGITLKGGDVAIKGINVDIEADAQVTVKGAVINLN